MPSFFAHKRGSVSKVEGIVEGTHILPFNIVMQGIDIGSVANVNTRAIITQAALVENGNFQFLHTLDETIYAYVFGDRIGELRVSGVCFTQPCSQGSGEIGGSSGIKQVIDRYAENRIANTGDVVLVNYGPDSTFKGFLTGMNVEVTDAERNLGQWSFRFHTFPGAAQ